MGLAHPHPVSILQAPYWLRSYGSHLHTLHPSTDVGERDHGRHLPRGATGGFVSVLVRDKLALEEENNCRLIRLHWLDLQWLQPGYDVILIMIIMGFHPRTVWTPRNVSNIRTVTARWTLVLTAISCGKLRTCAAPLSLGSNTSTVPDGSRNGMLPPICWASHGGNQGVLFWVNYMGSGWNGFGCCSNFAPCTYQNCEVGHFLHVEGRVGDVRCVKGCFGQPVWSRFATVFSWHKGTVLPSTFTMKYFIRVSIGSSTVFLKMPWCEPLTVWLLITTLW